MSIKDLKYGETVIVKADAKPGEESDIDKARKMVDNIRKQMDTLKVRMYKEHKAGKELSVIKPMETQWQTLQNRIYQIWKAYDQKHHTKYADGYKH